MQEVRRGLMGRLGLLRLLLLRLLQVQHRGLRREVEVVFLVVRHRSGGRGVRGGRTCRRGWIDDAGAGGSRRCTWSDSPAADS